MNQFTHSVMCSIVDQTMGQLAYIYQQKQENKRQYQLRVIGVMTDEQSGGVIPVQVCLSVCMYSCEEEDVSKNYQEDSVTELHLYRQLGVRHRSKKEERSRVLKEAS